MKYLILAAFVFASFIGSLNALLLHRKIQIEQGRQRLEQIEAAEEKERKYYYKKANEKIDSLIKLTR